MFPGKKIIFRDQPYNHLAKKPGSCKADAEDLGRSNAKVIIV